MSRTLYPNDAAIKAALTDEQAVAMTLIGEAASEPVEGQIAVACVIRNRVLRPARFQSTWKAVCLARWQFSCWIPEGGEANYRRLLGRTERCQRGLEAWPAQELWVARGVIAGAIRDRTAGATHYYASWMPAPPKWAVGQKPLATVGPHLFFNVA